MRYIKVFFLFILLPLLGFTQPKDPVKLQYDIKEISANTYEASLTARLDNGWHIYSKDLPPDSGIPTKMTVSGKGVELIGGVIEVGKKHDEFSEAFGAQIVYYSNLVVFKQKFKLKEGTPTTTVTAEITYQTCDDRVCLAPNTLLFEKEVKSATDAAETVAVTPTAAPHDTVTNTALASQAEATVPPTSSSAAPATVDNKNLKVATLDINNPLTNCGVATKKKSESYWNYLFLGFIGGLIALLTPCVFPMIPLTVSYFTKSQKNPQKGRRDAIIYAFFILLIFVLLSVPFHLVDGIAGNIFNEISTSVWLNLFFFAIFLFFALSFFGFYDITLPSSIANKSSRAEEAGGLIGIFFMALTLVIVSFSCTGPILGSLLGGVLSGSQNVPMLLTFALAGFGLSWALVFGLLALFPQTLNSLPKSGGWMTTVKVILGFIELALAFKFLSKADLVSKTFFLKRELFIAIWMLISLAMAAYLFGFIRFPHDDKKPKISLTRKILGVLSLGFFGYLLYGLFPAERPRLQLLSGILPPTNVSYFQAEDGILGMKPEHDFYKALEVAKQENKPVLIDFTGYGCENCRKMEEFVWSEPDVLPILQNEVVLASLYVDDKEPLPADQQQKIDLGEGRFKKISTIGDRWSLFQSINFNDQSQPVYALVTPDGRLLNAPFKGYDSDKEKFKAFLRCGIDYYHKNK